MTDKPQEGTPRPRTVSRLRFVAPPGMQLDAGEGTKTIGRYEIVKTIGRGAMGVVYKARDPLLDRIVAVKTIVSPQGVGKRVRSAYLERFQREAKAAAKMQHPAIVTIFDVGLDEELGAPFMVLEYLPGESLADRLDRVRLPLGRAITIASDLASALAFAHRQRIVHRDVKPANVLHAGENRWKLADFGIARMPDSDLTQVGIFMGTPGYAPPEAIREGRYTPQADVFAWGAVLYELLSGRIPYEGPDTKTTNSFVVKGDAPPPTQYDTSIPELISDVVMRAITPNAGKRLKDGAEAEQVLRETWERCLREGMVSPAALAGDEVPHEKVGAQMHGHVTNPNAWSHSGNSTVTDRPAPPPARKEPAVADETTDPGQVTTRREPPKAAGKAKAGKPPADGPMLVIESRAAKDRVGDDEPTRILVREEAGGRRDESSKSRRREAAEAREREREAEVRDDRVEAERGPSPEVLELPSGSSWVMPVVVALVLGGAGFAVWWFQFR
ncbi:MAG: serine/threonine protein kinase [Deltaproteobacteria bacterium]|nr:serine/threonine protein kinase [Deltaproteobacteria bacterium]